MRHRCEKVGLLASVAKAITVRLMVYDATLNCLTLAHKRNKKNTIISLHRNKIGYTCIDSEYRYI